MLATGSLLEIQKCPSVPKQSTVLNGVRGKLMVEITRVPSHLP